MPKLNKEKWFKIGAITLASGVLVGALGYYNFLYKDARGAMVLDPCPDFELDYVYAPQGDKMIIAEDQTFKMSQQLGKVVVLNFWATNCQPCKEEIPHFNELYENYHDLGLEVVILNGELSLSAQDLLDKVINTPLYQAGEYEKYYQYWPTYTCTFGRYERDNNILDLFEVSTALPVTVVVNRSGIITYMASGSLTYEKLETLVLPELQTE